MTSSRQALIEQWRALKAGDGSERWIAAHRKCANELAALAEEPSLREWVQHKPTCESLTCRACLKSFDKGIHVQLPQLPFTPPHNYDGAKCTCGLDAALSLTGSRDEGPPQGAQKVLDHDEAYAYLSRLFLRCAPQCEVLSTLPGLCTQIDNYIAGLHSRSTADSPRLREALERIQAWRLAMAAEQGTMSWRGLEDYFRELDVLLASALSGGSPVSAQEPTQ